MTLNKLIICMLASSVFFACNQQIVETKGDSTSEEVKNEIEAKFTETKKLAFFRESDLFNVLSNNISKENEQALKFLFAYMPLSDLADYNGEFFLKNVETTFKAKNAFSWGSNIPENIFNHFVLPVRINNENLDSSRWVFFEELLPRLKGLSMYEAALEVNHWCHEKVAYQPTDSRTSCPLASVKTAYGRCGEESTFTVAALRSVCIPARQCYTPLWAHCDDNHAWVEVWVDGKWYYLGACEPEPELNMAWFTAPAKRAMLVNSTVYGKYQGEEETINATEYYTQINQVSFYAPVRTIHVQVMDGNKAVNDAEVRFMLYNYAGFNNIALKKTDSTGTTSITTGKGDLMVWASRNGRFGYKFSKSSERDSIQIDIASTTDTKSEMFLQVVPPPPLEVEQSNSIATEENKRRLHQEDSIRAAYVSTFIDSASAYRFAQETGLDEERVWTFLKKSRGNWQELKYVMKNSNEKSRKFLFDFLDQISEKDLRDGNASYLLDHLHFATMDIPSEIPADIFIKYILNPRIERENLVPYRTNLSGFDIRKGTWEFTIDELIRWTAEKIIIDNERNYYGVRITPSGVYDLMRSDSRSRDIFFVALCRSRNIPARLEEETGKVQYYSDGQWFDVSFDDDTAENTTIPAKGSLTLVQGLNPDGIDPLYYIHFSIAKIENGNIRYLDYDWEKPLQDFHGQLQLDTGLYLLTTGNRNSQGAVACNMQFFNISENTTTSLKVNFASSKGLETNDFHIKKDVMFRNMSGKNVSLLKDVAESTSLVIFLQNENEPTKHLLNNLSGLKDAFKETDCKLYIISEKEISYTAEHYNLPDNIQLSGKTSPVFEQIPGLRENEFPYTLVFCRGKVSFFDQGYNIGTAEQAIKTIKNCNNL